jgi:nitroimidazol reductase NimA-like FMN-containing flavoprotein (pyridoxamine 5'-phosphate oxidase superfamily)
MPTIARPHAELDTRYSEAGVVDATPWSEARQVLDEAEVYWLSTLHPEGRPHVTPVIAVWLDGAAYFCTGPQERKAHNLAERPASTLMTGSNELATGLDVVVEGIAEPLTDDELLQPVADRYLDKYGDAWRFEVRDGGFVNVAGGRAVVFELAPLTAYAFARGPYSQTRYRF